MDKSGREFVRQFTTGREVADVDVVGVDPPRPDWRTASRNLADNCVSIENWTKAARYRNTAI